MVPLNPLGRGQKLHFLPSAFCLLPSAFLRSSVSLADKSLFIPVMNEVEEMQSIMVSTLNKLKEPKQ